MKTSIEEHRHRWRVVITFPAPALIYGPLQPPASEYICPVAETLRIAELQVLRLETYREAIVQSWQECDLDLLRGYISAARAHALYTYEAEQADAQVYSDETLR